MKKTLKNLLSVLLALIIIFSFNATPASAVNIYEENTFYGLIEIYDYGNEEDKNFFEKIIDTFHWYISRIFLYFEADCPICGEHFKGSELEYPVEYYYNKGINDIKNYKGKITVKKERSAELEFTDISVPSINSVLETVAQTLTSPKEETYVFENGVDSEGIKITDVIQPLGRNAELKEDSVTGGVWKATEFAERIVSMRLYLVAEESVFDGTTVADPVHNMSVIEPINPAALELGPITINQAEMTYTGTVVSAKFDEEEKVESIIIRVPFDATFRAGMGLIKFQASCRAEITEEYTIIYG